jgi:hypothetical protein
MSQTQHETQTDMPPMVVDRSPELARNNRTTGPAYGQNGVSTKDYRDKSVRGDGNQCVLARILIDQFPGCEPHIEGENPYIIMPDGNKRAIALSPILIEEIGKFDRGEPAFENMNISINIH